MKKKFLSCLSLLLIIVCVFTSVSVGALEYEPGIVYFDAKPDIIKVDKCSTSVRIEWESYGNNRDYTYHLYRLENEDPEGGVPEKIADIDGEKTYYVDKTVKPQKVYWYFLSVSYLDTSGRVDVIRCSREDSMYVSTEFPRPDFSLVGNSGKGILLKWNKLKDATGVMIYRSRTGKKGSWTKIKTLKGDKAGSYTDTNVLIGETYYYCFKTYKTIKGKNYYSRSSVAYKRTILDVSTPKYLNATAEKDGIRFTYGKSLGTIGYIIYRSDTGKKGTWTKMAVTKSNNTLTYLDTTAEKGRTYYYTVRSYKKVSGETTYSASAKAIRILYDTDNPVIDFSENEITFKEHYEEIKVELTAKNIPEEGYFRFFINGYELTDEILNDEKQLADFKNKCNFIFIADEESATENKLDLYFLRIKKGTGKLRVEHSENPKIAAEIVVKCPELPVDKSFAEINKLVDEGCEKAKEVLEMADDLNDIENVSEEERRAIDRKVYDVYMCFFDACEMFHDKIEYSPTAGYQADRDYYIEYGDFSEAATTANDVSEIVEYMEKILEWRKIHI